MTNIDLTIVGLSLMNAAIACFIAGLCVTEIFLWIYRGQKLTTGND